MEKKMGITIGVGMESWAPGFKLQGLGFRV